MTVSPYPFVRQARYLNGAGKEIVEFPGIMANVTYAKVLEGAEVARKHHVGLILAVGGGWVI